MICPRCGSHHVCVTEAAKTPGGLEKGRCVHCGLRYYKDCILTDWEHFQEVASE